MDYRRILEQKKGQLQVIDKALQTEQKKLDALIEEQEHCEEAQVIIQDVAQRTQEELKYQISELVTLALRAVFDDPYALEIEFVQKRNQIEAILWFVRNGNYINPLSSSGGGAVDIACFALRVSLWSLKKNRSRSILLLDEPFHRLKGIDANIRAIQMVKEISNKLNLQVLMVSDERVPLSDIEEGADKVFTMSIKKGISRIT